MDPAAIGINTGWVLVCACLVFFMQAGFALLEAGFGASKDVVNVIFKNLVDLMVGAPLFIAVGYFFLSGFDPDHRLWKVDVLLGTTDAKPAQSAPEQHDNVRRLERAAESLRVRACEKMRDANTSGFELDCTRRVTKSRVGAPDEEREIGGKIARTADVFFQTSFAVASVTIVSGAIAGRMRFVVYAIFATLYLVFLYPLSGYIAWNSGYIRDFAGAVAVHIPGGFAALTAAWYIGPRVGRFDDLNSPDAETTKPHNTPLATLGALVLWIGWFGFNCGSYQDLAGPGAAVQVGLIALNTALAGCGGGMAAMLCTVARDSGRPDLSVSINGVLAGLVAITAGCDVFSPIEAYVLGAIAGACMYLAIELLSVLKVDDAVGAFPVHGVGGVVGAIASSFAGFWWGGDVTASADVKASELLGTVAYQSLGTLFVAGASVVFTLVVLAGIERFTALRLSPDSQRARAGLDSVEHGHRGYRFGPDSILENPKE